MPFAGTDAGYRHDRRVEPGAGRRPSMLTVALSKGRICDEAAPLLARAGIALEEDPAGSRRLCIATSLDDVRVLVLRAQDVPTFVEHGAADLGIAGKDVLLEHPGGGLYEPLDLGIARCRLVLAEPRDAKPASPRPRVATKYVETARRYFAGRGVQAEIIRLYGSMEIAPAVGLADCVVDLVDTGATLAANGLVVREEIAVISARLVVNKAAMKLSHGRVSALVERIGRAAAGGGCR